MHPPSHLSLLTRRHFLKRASATGPTAMALSGGPYPAGAVAATAAAGAAVVPPDHQLPDLALPEVAGKNFRWAIAGLGKLALEEILPALPGIPQVNQLAAEMDHFSTCILEDTPTRTPGAMGLADQSIIRAIHKSLQSGKPVTLN